MWISNKKVNKSYNIAFSVSVAHTTGSTSDMHCCSVTVELSNKTLAVSQEPHQVSQMSIFGHILVT